MNIQKVKEALEAAKAELPELSSGPNGKEPKAIRAARLVCEAIAELEKPVDDEIDTVEQIYISFGDNYRDEATEVLNQYAESYHAKKCAECTKKKAPYKLFGSD